MTARQFRYTSLLLACCWLAALYFFSSGPSLDIGPDIIGKDKLFHMAAYGLLGTFILGSMRLHAASGYSLNQVALATLLAILYSLTDEWHQSYVPGRHADALDLVADFLGALLATLSVRALARRLLVPQIRG